MALPMYRLVGGVWELVSGATPHTHTSSEITNFGAAPTSVGQSTVKIPRTDGTGGWTYEDPPVGVGLAAGGVTGQTLTKQSATDYDTSWGEPLVNAFYSADLGAITASTPVALTHGLGTRDILVAVIEKTVAAPGEGDGTLVKPTISITSANQITLTFASSAPANTFRVRVLANGSSIVGAKDIRVQETEPTNARPGTVWIVPQPPQITYDMFGTNNAANMIVLGSATSQSATSTTITNAGGQAGGAYYDTKVTVVDWSQIVASWTMDVTAGGADGGAFVFLNTTNYASNPALGSGGGDIALISGQMFAVEFRTFSSDGLWIMPNGSGLHNTDTGYRNDWGGSHTYEVTVLPNGNITVKFDGTTIHSGTYALPTEAWIGFIGGTGGSSEVRTVSAGTLTFFP